jgi:hypothetical protein
MTTFRSAALPAMLMAMLLAAGCIQGSEKTTLNIGGKYKFVTEAVRLNCRQVNTGLEFFMSPLPSREFTVDVTRDGGAITLHSLDFKWNLINLRMDQDAATALPGVDLPGTVNDDGTFLAQTIDDWTNTGSAGPLKIRQRYEGKFTDTGVAGTYTVYLILQNYNTECNGSAGFTGQKLT